MSQFNLRFQVLGVKRVSFKTSLVDIRCRCLKLKVLGNSKRTLKSSQVRFSKRSNLSLMNYLSWKMPQIQSPFGKPPQITCHFEASICQWNTSPVRPSAIDLFHDLFYKRRQKEHVSQLKLIVPSDVICNWICMNRTDWRIHTHNMLYVGTAKWCKDNCPDTPEGLKPIGKWYRKKGVIMVQTKPEFRNLISNGRKQRGATLGGSGSEKILL